MLLGKNILVFGSNSEINLSIAERIVSDQAGKLFYVSSEKVDLDQNGAVEFIQLNFYDNTELERLVELLGNEKIDGIVYAGGMGGVRPLKLNSPDFVSQMFHQNVFTFFEIIRIMTKKRLINEGASIVALSSVSSIKGLKSKSVYSSSKAALDAAVRGMAAELADKKIRVNSIQKGWVSSDMNLDFIQSNMAVAENNDFEKQVLGAIDPKEIANLVVFLLSDQVKTLTGTNVLLDGGYTL